MNIDPYSITILISSLILLSYFFTILNQKLRIPSVLLLIGTGMGLNFMMSFFSFNFEGLKDIVQVLGVMGLILIILESSLDLKLSREKIPVIRDSFLSSFIILVISSLSLALILFLFLKVNFYHCFIYAIPLSIISSAIVIPSIHHLTERKKEFLIYEVTLSDILGIMFFNFFVVNASIGIESFFSFIGGMIFLVLISIVMTLLLIYLLSKTKVQLKFFIIFAVLVLLYSVGKKLNLSSLLLIFIFGLTINNHHYLFLIRKVEEYLNSSVLNTVVENLKMLTAEMSFFIRTFFFILFGFSIDLSSVIKWQVLEIGISIVGALILIRLLYLKLVLKTSLFPELFIMPRGLITILLFYNIPVIYQIPYFNEGILFFVIIVTGLLMMFGLIFYKDRKQILEKELIE